MALIRRTVGTHAPELGRCHSPGAGEKEVRHLRWGRRPELPSRGSVTAGRRPMSLPTDPTSRTAPEADRTAIRPFEVRVPEEQLTELRRRLAATRLPSKELV